MPDVDKPRLGCVVEDTWEKVPSRLTMKQLREYGVPSASLSIWWLGQGGFIVKSPAGVIAAIDPYLSNSCKVRGEMKGLNFDRLTVPPMTPQELVGIDLCALTHSHQDHLDPETIGPYLEAGGTGPFLAPAETSGKLRKMGVSPSQLVMTWPNSSHTVKDLTFRATFAIPYTGDDLTHVGYLVSAKDGPTFYFSGDTDYHDILAISVAEHHPNVMLAVINGAFRNMSAAQAALLAKNIKPEVVIPYHYDCFPDNRASPGMLKTNLFMYGMMDRYRELAHAKVFTFPE